MKKEYQQPQVKKVVMVECSQIICGSNDGKSDVNAKSENYDPWDEE